MKRLTLLSLLVFIFVMPQLKADWQTVSDSILTSQKEGTYAYNMILTNNGSLYVGNSSQLNKYNTDTNQFEITTGISCLMQYPVYKTESMVNSEIIFNKDYETAYNTKDMSTIKITWYTEGMTVKEEQAVTNTYKPYGHIIYYGDGYVISYVKESAYVPTEEYAIEDIKLYKYYYTLDGTNPPKYESYDLTRSEDIIKIFGIKPNLYLMYTDGKMRYLGRNCQLAVAHNNQIEFFELTNNTVKYINTVKVDNNNMIITDNDSIVIQGDVHITTLDGKSEYDITSSVNLPKDATGTVLCADDKYIITSSKKDIGVSYGDKGSVLTALNVYTVSGGLSSYVGSAAVNGEINSSIVRIVDSDSNNIIILMADERYDDGMRLNISTSYRVVKLIKTSDFVTKESTNGIKIEHTTNVNYDTQQVVVTIKIISDTSYDFELHSNANLNVDADTNLRAPLLLTDLGCGCLIYQFDQIEGLGGKIYAFAITKDTIPSWDGVVIDISYNSDETRFVKLMYNHILNIEPTDSVVAVWDSLLVSEQSTGADLVTNLFFGVEYLGKDKSNENYVDDLYRALWESADDGAKSEYLNSLKSNSSRLSVLNQFIYNNKFEDLCLKYGVKPYKDFEPTPTDSVAAFVTRLYSECLDRQPDNDGLGEWVRLLKNGNITGHDAAVGFLFSLEFIQKGVDDDAFLDKLYRVYFDRSPDTNGKNGWASELKAGKTKNEIVEGFSCSLEFSNLCCKYNIKAK